MKKKKAQLKIQQMAFMLLAVTLFFILVGMFLLNFKLNDLKEQRTKIAEDNARFLAEKIANSPEFSCGESFGTGNINCIDADKVMMLKENFLKEYDITNLDDNFWGAETNIQIRTIYPLGEGVECNLRTYPNCDIIKLFPKEINSVYETNVLLCKKQAYLDDYFNKCELAKLMVTYKKWD